LWKLIRMAANCSQSPLKLLLGALGVLCG
jgi:hypothetical protein